MSSSAVAALTQVGEVTRAERRDDAVWVLFTALASALAHGYAHQIAHRDAQSRPGVRGVVRAVLAEWPLVLAALPTSLLLCGASLGWWRSTGIEYVAFGINTGRRFGQHPAEVTRPLVSGADVADSHIGPVRSPSGH
ncbi:hypothetical protein AB4212_25185 [Streptomyces sp. 2MCAF27]